VFLHHRTPGLVLKRENSGEADQVFWIYSRDFGLLEVLGKGIRKAEAKLRGSLDIFCFSEIEFIAGRRRQILTDAVLSHRSSQLRKNLVNLRLAFRLARLFCGLVAVGEVDLKLWRWLQTTWSILEQEKLSFRLALLFYYYFFWNLVQFLGYRPRLDQDPFNKASTATLRVLRSLLDQPWASCRQLALRSANLAELKRLYQGYLSFLPPGKKKL